MPANPFLGSWRITHMDEWAPDYLDLIVPAFITIEPGTAGSFQFGAVTGWLDYRVVTTRDGARLEWSWQGSNDSDEACGRGWAVIDGAVLRGRLFIHASDDSGFVAVRPPSAIPSRVRRGSVHAPTPRRPRKARATPLRRA
jgi:hypothetical protein